MAHLEIPIVIQFDKEQLEEIIQKKIEELKAEGYIFKEDRKD